MSDKKEAAEPSGNMYKVLTGRFWKWEGKIPDIWAVGFLCTVAVFWRKFLIIEFKNNMKKWNKRNVTHIRVERGMEFL